MRGHDHFILRQTHYFFDVLKKFIAFSVIFFTQVFFAHFFPSNYTLKKLKLGLTLNCIF